MENECTEMQNLRSRSGIRMRLSVGEGMAGSHSSCTMLGKTLATQQNCFGENINPFIVH